MKDQSQSLFFDLSEYLPFQMSVISSRLFNKVVEASGLQLPEWRILMALPTHQPCSSQELSLITAMDAARVSRAQKRLEDLKLITVIRDRLDRRRLVVQLSDHGTAEVMRLKGEARAVESELLDAIVPEDRAQLRTTLGSLYERV